MYSQSQVPEPSRIKPCERLKIREYRDVAGRLPCFFRHMEHFHERPDGGKFKKIETTSTERFRHFSRDGNHLTAAGVWKTFQNVRSRSLLVVEVRSVLKMTVKDVLAEAVGFYHWFSGRSLQSYGVRCAHGASIFVQATNGSFSAAGTFYVNQPSTPLGQKRSPCKVAGAKSDGLHSDVWGSASTGLQPPEAG